MADAVAAYPRRRRLPEPGHHGDLTPHAFLHRSLRMAQAIREVVAKAILFEMADPRVRSVTVLGVEVSSDSPVRERLRFRDGDPRSSRPVR